ncbi:hypothetical protein PC113_g23047 [Phytophthora cactorum]|uniref:Uncharacterized protein n=1 Tax=Phytophthora cactorum TaxID=29920 RepID=A0A8T0Y8G2_9STRA|nr:hypothetical protein PC111_g22894 [Phytophthora cactorum]KAG2794247.1 hypothetical protein PC112_g23114 [Phytophthora cactorum]KAG2816798.1 hypothetical protein PC113_g23047 [Phytophthora cactorum]KAG3154932.1 hypothetical protein PC128_g22206 [Phytophthora cactorum]
MHPLASRAPNNTAEDLHLTRVAKDAGTDAYLVVCPLTQKIAELSKLFDILRTPSACSPTPRAVSPQEVLVVTDLMLTGDYDGARKAALAPSWSSRLSSGHPVAHHEDAPAHRHVAWLLCLRH